MTSQGLGTGAHVVSAPAIRTRLQRLRLHWSRACVTHILLGSNERERLLQSMPRW